MFRGPAPLAGAVVGLASTSCCRSLHDRVTPDRLAVPAGHNGYGVLRSRTSAIRCLDCAAPALWTGVRGAHYGTSLLFLPRTTSAASALQLQRRWYSSSHSSWMSPSRVLRAPPGEKSSTDKAKAGKSLPHVSSSSTAAESEKDAMAQAAATPVVGSDATKYVPGSAAPSAPPGDEDSATDGRGTIVHPSARDTRIIHRALAEERVQEVGDQKQPGSPEEPVQPPSPVAPDEPAYAGGMRKRAAVPSGVATAAAEDPNQIPVWDVVTKVLFLLWPKGEVKVKVLVASSVACVLTAKVLKVAVPFWFKSIVDLLAPSSAVVGATATVGPFTVGVFGCVVAYGICRITASITEELKTALFAPVGGHASTRLAMEMFGKLHYLDLRFHLNRETGVLSKDLDRGSRAFWSLAYTLLFTVVPTIFEMALVCGALSTQAGPVFNIIAVVAVVAYIAWTYAITNWRAKFRTQYNILDSRVGGLIVDSLLNYETVKYFGTEKYELARIETETTKMNNKLVRLDQTMALLNFGQSLIFVTAGVLSLYLAVCGVMAGAMTVGDLVLIDALLMQLYMPLSYLGMIYREVQASTQNMQAMIALLNQESQVVEAPNAKPYVYADGTIEMKNVCFQYKKDDGRPVLQNLSLTIPGGKTVAFVGPSGSGKSTIFRLLFRFYDPVSGEIHFDGQPLSKLQLSTVRKSIGVVPQDTVLFNESVSYNIRYGRMSATDEEVVAAAKRASLHDTVQRMSDGYDTSVGERGLKLSGGEKQRVAIARVVLEDPPILLADEATSALDSTTESNVMQTLKTATGRKKRRTIILIAHRLTTVKEADLIYVLDGKGGLAEHGEHDELLKKGGLYAEMWHQQQRASRVAAGESDPDEEKEEAEGAAHTAGDDAPKSTPSH